MTNPFKRESIKELYRKKMQKQKPKITKTRVSKPVIKGKRVYRRIVITVVLVLIVAVAIVLAVFFFNRRDESVTIGYKPYPGNMLYPLRKSETTKPVKLDKKAAGLKKQADDDGPKDKNSRPYTELLRDLTRKAEKTLEMGTA